MRYESIHLKDTFAFLGEDDKDPILEVYLTEKITEMGLGTEKHPVLLICPGGAYAYTSRREAEPIGLNFLAKGFHVFILSYSCAPHAFPTQLREVAAAMELIHANAECWDGDPEKTAIMGFSAGGHLAAHYANGYNWPEVREAFPQSKPVQACVLGYPVITVEESYTHKNSICNLLGREPSAEDLQRFSCQNMVTEQTPPTFLWHTNTDPGVPAMNTILYAQALYQNKRPMEVHIYPTGPHGMATADAQTCIDLPADQVRVHNWLDDAAAWLHQTL